MNLNKSQTLLNLAKAYAGECQARTRYEFLEYGLRYNGYNAVASVIDKLAYQEFNHARMMYTYIQNCEHTIDNIEVCSGYPFKQKWDYVENLRLASIDELNEVDTYGAYSKTASDEGFTEIANLFDLVAQVEKTHSEILADLYDKLSNDTLYKSKQPRMWTCSSCGHCATSKTPWKQCPLCGAKIGYVQIDECSPYSNCNN